MRFTSFAISEEYGVAIGFLSVLDRERYLMDPLTSSTFRKCTESEAYEFLYANGYRWGMPRTFYECNLAGLEVMYSEAA